MPEPDPDPDPIARLMTLLGDLCHQRIDLTFPGQTERMSDLASELLQRIVALECHCDPVASRNCIHRLAHRARVRR